MATTHIDSLWLLALASKSKYTYSINLFLFITIFALACCVKILFQWARPGGPAWSKPKRKSTIPGPRGYPFIGSMHLMTGLAHRKLAAAANYCGASRLMAFSLGETRVVVTCNPEVAKDILNSSDFADRPVKESAYRLMFNRAIGFAPYGVYWRTLRRIAATHLFCPKQIIVSEPQRTVICSQMVEMLQNQKKTTSSVCVREVLKRASLSNMMWSVFGRKYRVDSNDADSVELRKLVDEGYDLLGVLNWTDHLPWLSDFDLQGVRSRCSKLVPKVNRFVKRIIDEHRDQPSHVNSDFTDVLLSLDGSDKLSEPDMIAVLWEMIFRGTDTVAVLIEWILARLVLHPDVQQKVQEELDRVVGRSRAVTEADITSLVYLPAVVKEVLRLHPPANFKPVFRQSNHQAYSSSPATHLTPSTPLQLSSVTDSHPCNSLFRNRLSPLQLPNYSNPNSPSNLQIFTDLRSKSKNFRSIHLDLIFNTMVVNGRGLKRMKRRVTADLNDFLTFPSSEVTAAEPFRTDVRTFLLRHALLPPMSSLIPHLLKWQMLFRVGERSGGGDDACVLREREGGVYV